MFKGLVYLTFFAVLLGLVNSASAQVDLKVDIGADRQVDFDDVAIFLKDWLECTLNPPELCWQ